MTDESPEIAAPPTASPTPGSWVRWQGLTVSVAGLTLVVLAGVGYFLQIDTTVTIAFVTIGAGLVFVGPVIDRLEGKQELSRNGISVNVTSVTARAAQAVHDLQSQTAQAVRGEAPLAKQPSSPSDVDVRFTGKGELDATVVAIHPAGRPQMARIADSASRAIAFRNLLETPESRVIRASETFKMVYSFMRSGSPTPGGPRLLEEFPAPPESLIMAGVEVQRVADQVGAGQLKMTHDDADTFVRSVAEVLRAIDQSFRSEPPPVHVDE